MSIVDVCFEGRRSSGHQHALRASRISSAFCLEISVIFDRFVTSGNVVDGQFTAPVDNNYSKYPLEYSVSSLPTGPDVVHQVR